MFFGSAEDEARALHEEALAALDRGELAAARALAETLRAMRWSGAFEVLALAARAEGDLESAIAALEEGVAAAPRAWALRQLLGNFHDEAGRHADALRAYEGALACEGAWSSSVRFNRAVALLRAGDAGGALADAERVLEDPATPPFTLDALRVAIDALERLGRAGDAVSLVRATGASLAPEDALGRAEIAAFAALAEARAGAPAETVRASIEAAIEGGAGRGEIVEALARVAGGAVVETGWRVVIAAPAPPGADEGIAGYMRVIEVRAGDEARARELACSLEPSAIRGAIAIEECRAVARDPGPAGVIAASGRIWFGGE